MDSVDTMLPYAGQEVDSYMVSVEMMLPYDGQKADSYIVSIDSDQIFSGLHELHDPN